MGEDSTIEHVLGLSSYSRFKGKFTTCYFLGEENVMGCMQARLKAFMGLTSTNLFVFFFCCFFPMKT